MNKRILIIIIPLILLLTGCYDYKELNSISILSATEINKIDDEFIVSAQAINPQAPDKTANTQAPFIIYTGKGKSIQEAYRNITDQSSKFLYSNHLQILIINEKVAKEDISQVIDFYMRNPAIRTEFYILIGQNDNIINVITPIDDISSSSIKEGIENNFKYLGTVNTTTFNELADMYLNPNIEIILPSIKIIHNNEEENKNNKEGENLENVENTKVNTTYKLDGFAIFKNNKLQGYLTEEQSKTYNIIQNKINNTILTYECDKSKYMTIEIINSKSSIDIKNNKINIKVKMTGNLNEYQCNENLNSNKVIENIEKKFEKELSNTLKNNINEIKTTYNSDIFGFLDKIYKTDYQKYQKIKNNWYDSTYQNLELSLKTDISIIAKGNIMEAINEKNK